MEYYNRSHILTALIHFIVWLAELALILRIIFRLFAANPNASFVHWIYTTTDNLLAPFRGIFPNAVISKGSVLDFTALFALIIYGVVGSFLIYIVNLLERSATGHVVTTKKTRTTR